MIDNNINFLKRFALIVAFLFCNSADAAKPNIIYILADDMGSGDVQILNAERGKIPTPHMDSLARGGIIFTDAHSGSSVCTPSRYGILTGRHSWRTRLQSGVVAGYSKSLIRPDRLTVAGFLKQQGYATACIGKWHLGLDMPTTEGGIVSHGQSKDVDWKGTIKNGPNAVGFDYFYGISASLDIPPYIYIENDRFVGECTTEKAFHRKGAAHEDFEAVDVLPLISRKTTEFIQEQNFDEPFFAYVSLTSPHTPIVTTAEWKGKSGLGGYADFVMQTDAVVGEIVAAVNAAGLGENTIIIVTSDNGCSPAAPFAQLEAQGHFPSAQFRGTKSDIWDGGHRVPFIVSWPDVVQPGAVSDELICLTDLIATCADVLGVKLPNTAGEDSVSFAPALRGQAIVSSRAGIIHHSISGHFAYRLGKWKLCLAKGSGGWSAPTESSSHEDSPIAQLYDMEADPGETTNLYTSHPEVARRLLSQLELDVQRGRSTAGVDVLNDVKNIILNKNEK